MKILGIDFTSAPSRRKPITCITCTLEDDVLRMQSFAGWSDFKGFEAALAAPGPWIAGIDFPFGQSRRFIENIGWPTSWAAYVQHAGQLGREGFREALNRYKEHRPAGDRQHKRETDKATGGASPQTLYFTPVGLMFFEGAPRLLASGATITHLQEGDPQRIVVEAYPGVLARRLIGIRSYKNDTRAKQTADQLAARHDILRNLRQKAPPVCGFRIEAPDSLCDDPSADKLDALLCAVQAAWAWRQRENRFGAPEGIDRLEGWIANPPL